MIEYSKYSLWFITCQGGEKSQKLWQVDVILGNCEEMLKVKNRFDLQIYLILYLFLLFGKDTLDQGHSTLATLRPAGFN